MFRQWRAQRLIQRLTGLKARHNAIYEMFKGIGEAPQSYIDQQLDFVQQIAELEFKIEMLKDVK
jgi:hypothetical protein